MGRHKSRVKQPQAVQELMEQIPVPVKTNELNDDDLAIMADQCFHNNKACLIGTYTSTIFKYCVNYCNRWYFVAYNRDEGRIHCPLKFDMLGKDEVVRFQFYKNRLEQEMRVDRLRNLPKSKPSIIRPHIVAMTPEEEPPAIVTEDPDDATV